MGIDSTPALRVDDWEQPYGHTVLYAGYSGDKAARKYKGPSRKVINDLTSLCTRAEGVTDLFTEFMMSIHREREMPSMIDKYSRDGNKMTWADMVDARGRVSGNPTIVATWDTPDTERALEHRKLMLKYLNHFSICPNAAIAVLKEMHENDYIIAKVKIKE